MTIRSTTTSLLAATALMTLAAGPAVSAAARRGHPAPHAAARSVNRHVAQTPPGVQRPSTEVLLSIGQGERITLPAAVTDVWVSNPEAADVYVTSARQLNLFGKGFGEATVFATGANGDIVYSANIRVSQNLTSVDSMLRLAMPEADIRVVTAGQIAVLVGTVPSPEDAAEAQRLVTSMLNPGVDLSQTNAVLKMAVVSRLRTATPLQVNLQVRIAEVSRSFVKNIDVNFASADGTGGFQFGAARGRGGAGGTQYTPGGPLGVGFTTPPSNGSNIVGATGATTLGLAGRLLGLNLLGSLDLGETLGQVTTLANPNLTCLSGETCTFLAGGEIPIPISQGLGAVSVDYKPYGVGLAYTATVLSNGRISLRVRPEVSQLSAQGAVRLNGTTIPALTTRRAESTLELGSGQSMVIGGLLQNDSNNSIDQTPGLGNIPVLGALFRSNAWRRNETELMIVITPYLVRPVDNPADIVLPTDGARTADDASRILLGRLGGGTSGARRPVGTMAPASAPPPVIGATAPAAPQPGNARGAADARAAQPQSPRRAPAPMPGFSTN